MGWWMWRPTHYVGNGPGYTRRRTSKKISAWIPVFTVWSVDGDLVYVKTHPLCGKWAGVHPTKDQQKDLCLDSSVHCLIRGWEFVHRLRQRKLDRGTLRRQQWETQRGLHLPDGTQFHYSVWRSPSKDACIFFNNWMPQYFDHTVGKMLWNGNEPSLNSVSLQGDTQRTLTGVQCTKEAANPKT